MHQTRRGIVVVLAALGIAACSKPPEEPAAVAVEAAGPASGVDYHSYANTDDYRTTHIDLDFSVDFDRKVLIGEVRLQLDRVNDASEPLVLDTHTLDIASVRADVAGRLREVEYAIGPHSKDLGAPLTIQLPDDASAVVINYESAPEALGLQWLEPEQTAGKRYPFLYSQGQSVFARSFIPLQDTPGIRATYDATVRTPPELRAVMSADNDPGAEMNGVFSFSMPQPIPSYLIALAVGELEFRAIGDRTGVYAEKEQIDAAAAEFEDTQAMLEAAEQAYGAYRWGRYDLLVLPPSFPLGGMENPRLSFVTPTLIAGDKSLVSTIAHELAHSWSGNLVTNASWRDLWLNEGFTTYLTYRIMQIIYGDERYEMELALSYDDLQSDLLKLDDEDEILAIDLRNRDPEDVFTSIPYEKGGLFLYELEQSVGRDAFDRFLLDYFNRFAFQSITTEDFIAYIGHTLLKVHADELDTDRVRQWIFEPGLPDGAPHPVSASLTGIQTVRHQWLSGEIGVEDIDVSTWTYHHWKRFLDGMPERLRHDKLEELENRFNLTESTNSEIAFSWLRIAIRNDYRPAYGRLDEFLHKIGRSKFLKPLYEDMVEAGMSEMAWEIFESARPSYHPMAAKAVEKILEKAPP